MRVLLVLVVCMSAVVAFIYAQDSPTTGAIYGRVLSIEQAVIGEADVEVVSGPGAVGTKVRSRGPNSVMYDGGFLIPRLLPGTYSVKMSHKKYLARTYEGIEVSAGKGTYIVAELPPMEDVAGSISGTVSIKGVSVKGFVVGYVKEEDKKPVETVTLDTDGRYSFSGVLPGKYHVTVTKDREEIYRSDAITVTKKKNSRHAIRISPEALLEKPGWISGKVLGPDRKPVNGASISLIKMPEGQRKVSGRTGSDGKYELQKLRPGSYELKASKPGVGEDTARTYVRSNRGKTVNFYLKPK